MAVYGSSNILFDSVQALWNNWGGLGIYSTNNFTVQNSVASHNGGMGIIAAHDQNALLNFNETDYNNWRGAEAALFDWGMGGTKLMYMRNTTVQNHFSYNNLAQGLWLDTDNKNVTVNNATLSGNVLAGLQLEANQGPIELQNSSICSQWRGGQPAERPECLHPEQHTSSTTAEPASSTRARSSSPAITSGHSIIDCLRACSTTFSLPERSCRETPFTTLRQTRRSLGRT